MRKKTNKQAKKKTETKTDRKQSNSGLYYCSICKNTQTRSHSSLREMRDRVTQYAIKLHA